MHVCTFVILGATGDLSKRKLIPAIYKLIQNKKLERFAVLGVALPHVSEREMLEPAKKFIEHFDQHVWELLEKNTYYLPFNFYEDADYEKLSAELARIEKKHRLNGNRLFYLATMPQHFSEITKKLASHGIAQKSVRGAAAQAPFQRIVYEKPFGYDLKSARAINRAIAKVFNEDQVFRIDHYLGKEVVGDIALVRFTNRVFEPLWSNKHIESVQIVLSEKIGIEGRGLFYDHTGALRDVVQSHMLQLLALVAMESPKELLGKYIRDAKAAVLKKVKPEKVIFGQYEGYRNEADVQHNSNTETFAAMKLSIHNRRWSGVPFYIKTGKHLEQKETVIHIKFKMVKCLLAKSCPSDSNYLTIQIHPNEGFYLELNSKVPGVPGEVQPVKMEYCHSCLYGPNTPEAYETLLSDVLRGDQSVFLRNDEIELSWKIIDKARSLASHLYPYKKGSKGPKEADAFDKDLRWRS